MFKMTGAEKVVLASSGGKESALALYELQKTNGYDVPALLTTVTEGYDGISMHGVQRTLVERQAEPLWLLLDKVLITPHEALQTVFA